MDQVLVVSSSKDQGEALAQMLKKKRYERILLVASGAQARRQVQENVYRLIIINGPLSDETGETLALDLAGSSPSGIMLLVKREWAEEVRSQVQSSGVFVLEKPIGRDFFDQALNLLEAYRQKLVGLEQKNLVLMQKIQDIRLVNQAKIALIRHLDLTEDQAHKFIEKQAMNRRVSKRDVAKGILRTYESEGSKDDTMER